MSIKSFFKRVFGYPILIEAPAVLIQEPVGTDPELGDPQDNGSFKLGVIVGHTSASPGAELKGSQGTCEYHYNKVIANKMEAYANSKGNIKVEIIYRDVVGILGAYTKARQLLCDAAIELHFNAYNEKISGTETLCSIDANDSNFAHYIQRAVCQVFTREGTSRGVKAISKSERGGVNVYSFPGGANCLVEPFFGDHAEDAKAGVRLADDYAKALVDASILWAKNIDLLK